MKIESQKRALRPSEFQVVRKAVVGPAKINSLAIFVESDDLDVAERDAKYFVRPEQLVIYEVPTELRFGINSTFIEVAVLNALGC